MPSRPLCAVLTLAVFAGDGAVARPLFRGQDVAALVLTDDPAAPHGHLWVVFPLDSGLVREPKKPSGEQHQERQARDLHEEMT